MQQMMCLRCSWGQWRARLVWVVVQWAELLGLVESVGKEH